MNVLIDELEFFEPITDTQEKVWEAWKEGHNLVLTGSAGTGKTFIALYLALREFLQSSLYRKIIVVRSVVPTRDIGFLPGDEKTKKESYTVPYKGLLKPHVHYRVCGGNGMLSRVETVNLH